MSQDLLNPRTASYGNENTYSAPSPVHSNYAPSSAPYDAMGYAPAPVRSTYALQQQQQQQQQQRTGNGQPAALPRMTQEQYKAMMVQQQRQQSQNSGVHNAQTDGSGDLEESMGLIKRVNADGEEVMGRIEIDALIRDKIAAMGQRMEGGGLMLPLHQATNSKKRQRKVARSATVPGQLDGPDSDDEKSGVKDELDEDAINSDLDDPEDNSDNGDEEDESMGHVMLCMYDKVQRVKNKW